MNEIKTTVSKWYVDNTIVDGYGIPVSHAVDISPVVNKLYNGSSTIELTTTMLFNKRGGFKERVVEAVFVSAFNIDITGNDKQDLSTLKTYVSSTLEAVESYLSDHLPASMLQIRPPLIWESKTDKLIASAFSALK